MDWQILFNTGFLQVFFTLVSLILVYRFLQNLFDKVIRKPSQPLQTRRRLGKFEAGFDQLSQERGGTGNVCLIVSLKSKTKLSKDHVRKALLILAKRQPMFRAVITTSPSWSTLAKDRYFEIMGAEEIVDMLDFTSVDVKARDWQDVWHEIASKKRGTGLLWRAVILQEEFLPETESYVNTVIFKLDHACCDGVSSMKLCKQFLRYLNDVAQGSRTGDEDICSRSLMPSLFDLVTHGRPWSILKFVAECLGIRRISKFIMKTVIRRMLSSKQCNPFFVKFPPSMERSASPWLRSDLIYKTFSETETSKILKVCKSNGCTVTGALMAAVHMAFCKLIQDESLSDKKIHLEHCLPINAQRNCHPKPPEEYFGQFALPQFLSLEYTVEDGDLWKLALDITQRIQQDLREDKYITENMTVVDSFSAEELLDEIFSPPDWHNFVRLSGCNNLSSAGSFEFGEEQKQYTYKLHECLFNTLIHCLATTFVHDNVTVNGKMSWSILYDPSRVMAREAEKFSKMCFDYFLEIDQ